MDFSFVVIDKKNQLDLNNFKLFVSQTLEKYEIIYCNSKKISDSNVRNYVFLENENTEKILNTVIKKCECNNIIIIRDISCYKDIVNLINSYKYNNQIVLYKKKQAKFKTILFNAFSKLTHLFFNHKLLSADYSVCLYGEIATRVLKNVQSPAVLLRTNNWTGLEFVLIGETCRNYKFEYNKLKSVLKTIVPFLLAIIMVTIHIVFKFKFVMLGLIFYYFIIIFSIFLSVLYALDWFLNNIMGSSVPDKAKYE